jgi:hypothetical protein
MQEEVLEWESGRAINLQVLLLRGKGEVRLLTEDEAEQQWAQGEVVMRWLEANRPYLRGYQQGGLSFKDMDVVVDLVGLQGKRGSGRDFGVAAVVAVLNAMLKVRIEAPERTVVMAGLEDDSGVLLYGLGGAYRVPHAAALVKSLVAQGCSRVVVAQGVADSLRDAAAESDVELEVVGVRLVDEALALLLPGVLQRPLVLKLDSVTVYRMPPGHVRHHLSHHDHPGDFVPAASHVSTCSCEGE